MKWLKDADTYYNTNQIVRIVRDMGVSGHDIAYIYFTDGRCVPVVGIQCEAILNFCGENVLEVQKPELPSSGFTIHIRNKS